jgi:predicted small integral membrane protein
MKKTRKKFFVKVGMCVWLVENKIVGWKVNNSFIGHPLSYNTLNWSPFRMFDKFKKLNLYVPYFLYNFVFTVIAGLYFRRWKHHEKFKGFKAYHEL